MLAHYKKILKDADSRVAYSLRTQVHKEGNFKGGFVDREGLVHSKYAVYRTTGAIAAYCNVDSAFYRSPEVFQMIRDGLTFIRNKQHENGLFDLIHCNFSSAPDTAFCMKRMLPTLKFLDKNRKTEEEEMLYRVLVNLVKQSANGLMQGGFHTPNHRWVIASNLMECGLFFSDENMYSCAEQYLNEGIDCNMDGEFAERSAGNYNRINNDAMITLGDVTGEDRYYEYAIRNLNMMLTYLEPDGSIFTANSTRQDKGELIFPKDYYMEYLDIGYRKQLPEFLDVANYIFSLIERESITAPDCLIFLMNRPELKYLEHEGLFAIPDFQKWYRDSGIVRSCRHGYSYTLLAEKSDFLYFTNGALRLQMKICGGFCEHRAFKAEEMKRIPGGYQLNQTMRGWYYLPLEEKQETSDWWKMDHTKRKKIPGSDLRIQVEVMDADDGVDVHLKLTGVEDAPFRVEIEVAGAKLLWNEHLTVPAEHGGSLILKQGNACFSNQTDSMVVGPGFGSHLFTDGMFGSEAHSACAYILYFTDYTEMDHVIHIRKKEVNMYNGG